MANSVKLYHGHSFSASRHSSRQRTTMLNTMGKTNALNKFTITYCL